ncbi:jg11863 [Pararge aegeria aegeria]|uniref:Jg11863 protein n=1 Tax=Pararge aegeria aegeria TaxID=348720 RepID=A0A8S4SK78_9NEOP|nr:jg11863 [Pararge aegeria aegeria]
MSNIPLVRRAIVGAALAQSSVSNEPLESPDEGSQWTPAALERAGSTLKALNRMAKRPPVHILFEDVGFTVSSGKETDFDITRHLINKNGHRCAKEVIKPHDEPIQK